MNWTPIKEKHPEFNEPVMVCDMNDKNSFGICRLDKVVTSSGGNGKVETFGFLEGNNGCDNWWHNVTHWMPLPEFPK